MLSILVSMLKSSLIVFAFDIENGMVDGVVARKTMS
jgi:hypothetical protein